MYVLSLYVYVWVCLDIHTYNPSEYIKLREVMEGSDGEVQVSGQEPDAFFLLI